MTRSRLAGWVLLVFCACPAGPETLKICHRGTAGDAPENTIAGIRAAIQTGCQVVEVDVRTTRDGHPVLAHDSRIRGLGRIEELPLQQVRPSEPELQSAEQYGDTAIPELSAVLSEFEDDLRFYLDLKTRNLDAITSVVRAQNASRRVLYRAYLPSQWLRLRHLDPDAMVIVDAEVLYRSSSWRRQLFAQAPQVILSVEAENLTEELLRFIEVSELPWILNFPEESKRSDEAAARPWGVLRRF